LTRLLLIALGGAVGAVLRYGVSTGVYRWLGQGFPYGTVVVNVTGSLAMGILYVLFLERGDLSAEWRAAVLVGLLGAFTTFSTFSIETVSLFESREHGRAIANIVLSVWLCLMATWMGVSISRRML
jgi:CrcB protein